MCCSMSTCNSHVDWNVLASKCGTHTHTYIYIYIYMEQSFKFRVRWLYYDIRDLIHYQQPAGLRRLHERRSFCRDLISWVYRKGPASMESSKKPVLASILDGYRSKSSCHFIHRVVLLYFTYCNMCHAIYISIFILVYVIVIISIKTCLNYFWPSLTLSKIFILVFILMLISRIWNYWLFVQAPKINSSILQNQAVWLKPVLFGQ